MYADVEEIQDTAGAGHDEAYGMANYDEYHQDSYTNPLGYWEADKFRIQRFVAEPTAWLEQNVECFQTMGSISLAYDFQDAEAGLAPEDIRVEASSWQLKVTRSNGDSIRALTGLLFAAVRRNFVSWKLVEEEDSGRRFLHIRLTKVEHRAWRGLWSQSLSMQSAGRKSKFGWTKQQADADHYEQKLSAVPHDTVPTPAEPASQIDLEAMCVCRNDIEEFDDYTFCYVHLDRALLEELEAALPFEECFGVDVTERHVRAYFLAHEELTVFEADFADRCIPEYTFWQLVRARKGDPKGRGEAFNPALQIGIVKHPDAHGKQLRFVERCRHLDEIVNEKRYAEEAEYRKCEDKLRARCLELCGRDAHAQTAHRAPDPGSPGALAAPRPEQPGKQLPEEANYLIDNSQLRAKTKGLGYRRSPILIDKDGEELAPWGTIVRGVDLGSGWLKVGGRYLPMKLNGEQVLTGDVIGLPGAQPEKHEYV